MGEASWEVTTIEAAKEEEEEEEEEGAQAVHAHTHVRREGSVSVVWHNIHCLYV